jgi:hypothetical protein
LVNWKCRVHISVTSVGPSRPSNWQLESFTVPLASSQSVLSAPAMGEFIEPQPRELKTTVSLFPFPLNGRTFLKMSGWIISEPL